MYKGVWWVCAAFAIAVVTAAAATPAQTVATEPSRGSGSYVVTGATVTDVRTAGGNTFVTETETAEATGTITGTFVHDIVVVIHADGSLNFHGNGTFTGTVDGVSGGFAYSLEGQGMVPSELHGTFTIQSGSGDLSGLRGHATITGAPATGGTYTLQFHMEP